MRFTTAGIVFSLGSTVVFVLCLTCENGKPPRGVFITFMLACALVGIAYLVKIGGEV